MNKTQKGICSAICSATAQQIAQQIAQQKSSVCYFAEQMGFCSAKQQTLDFCSAVAEQMKISLFICSANGKWHFSFAEQNSNKEYFAQQTAEQIAEQLLSKYQNFAILLSNC